MASSVPPASTWREFPALEYGLHHELVSDHVQAFYTGHHLEQLHEIRSTASPIDVTGLPELQLPLRDAKSYDGFCLFEPAPVFNDEAAQSLLESSLWHLGNSTAKDLTVLVCAPRLAKDRKLRLPLLRTDNEADCRLFYKDVFETEPGTHDILPTADVPLEPVDYDNDEGVELPSGVRRYASELFESIRREVPDLTLDDWSDVLDLLPASPLSVQDQEFFLNEALTKPLARTQRLSPPITPLQYGHQAYVPNEDVARINTPSEVSMDISSELRLLEEKIMASHDNTSPEVASSMLLPSSESGLVYTNTSVRPSDLKLEASLVKDKLRVPSPTSQEALEGALKLAAEELEKSRDISDLGAEPFSEEVQQLTKKGQREIMLKLEQEKLLPADTLARMPVPRMDFSLPEAPWLRCGRNYLEMYRWIKSDSPAAFDIPLWPLSRREEQTLRWSPLGRGTGRIRLQDIDRDFGCDQQEMEHFLMTKELNSGLNCLQNLNPSHMMLCLRDESDNEDLEPTCEQPHKTPLDAIKLPPAIISEAKQLKRSSSGPEVRESERKRTRLDDLIQLHKQKLPAPSTTLLGSQTPDEANAKLTRCVNSYGELRTGRRFLENRIPNPADHGSLNSSLPKPLLKGPAQNGSDPTPTIPTPCPSFVQPTFPVRLIISCLVSASIIRKLEALLPTVELIDCDLILTGLANSIPSEKQTLTPSILPVEADILISPATGILLTNVLTLRQKPLINSQNLSPSKQRLLAVSQRYDRVIVLVSLSPTPVGMNPSLTASESKAYCELVAFATTLDCDMVVQLIGAEDDAVAKWTASCICQYAAEGKDCYGFIQANSTNWELALRRAGLNMIAAQAMAGALRADFGDQGFLRLAQMPGEEKVARYQRLLGGSRALNCVSDILLFKWI